MQWLRLYDDVLDDPKAQRLTGAMFKHWINLLCLASKGNPRGVIPSTKDVAFRLRIRPADADRIMCELESDGLMERTPEGHWMPHEWTKRQKASDDSAPRVQRHRDKSAPKPRPDGAQTASKLLLETAEVSTHLPRSLDTELQPSISNEAECNVTVTPHARKTRQDTDTDTETDTQTARTPTHEAPVQRVASGVVGQVPKTEERVGQVAGEEMWSALETEFTQSEVRLIRQQMADSGQAFQNIPAYVRAAVTKQRQRNGGSGNGAQRVTNGKPSESAPRLPIRAAPDDKPFTAPPPMVDLRAKLKQHD